MKFRLFVIACFVSVFLIAGCSALTPPTPTPTPAPTALPTDVPTATALPQPTKPSATATQPNPLPQAIAFALNKTQDARSLKYDFKQGLTIVQDGKTQEIPVLVLAGADSTLNRQVTISGTTSDTNEFITYEVIVLGEDAYIRGVTGVDNVDPKKWYALPEAAQAGVRQLPSARGLIASFSPEDVGKAEFKSAGSEVLNEENCTVWQASNEPFAQVLMGVSADSELKKQVGEIDTTEVKLWTCADGFIHQLLGSVQGHSADNKANTVKVTLSFVMRDFNLAIKIDPPAEFLPFPTRQPQAQPTEAAPTKATNGTAEPTKPISGTAEPTETKSATVTPTP